MRALFILAAVVLVIIGAMSGGLGVALVLAAFGAVLAPFLGRN